MKQLLALLPVVVCGCVMAAPDPQTPSAPVDAGYYVAWQTVDTRGVVGDCKTVADVVRITSHDATAGQASVHNFDCRAPSGEIGKDVGPGSTVRVELVDCGGSFCLDGGTSVAGFSVDTVPPGGGNGRVGLGTFAFDAL